MLWHPEIEIKVITSGSATITIEDKDFFVKEGDILLVNPFESHKMIADNVSYYILLCSPKYFLKKFDNNDFYDICMPFINGQLRFPNVITDQVVAEIIIEIFNAKKLKYSYISQEGLLNHLFAYMFSNIETYSVGIEKALYLREKSKIEPAIQYIEEHIEEDMDIDKLASLCHVNKFYFSRLFKSAMMITPHDYVNMVREQKAEHDLLCTTKKISQIAKEIGINDEYYFSRWFKKRHGISPNEFRTTKLK
jgi:xylan 1,4-beta-xylosidase